MTRFRKRQVYYRFSRLGAWRLQQRALFVIGGILVGAVAILVARLADQAQAAYRWMLSISPYAGLLVTPLGFAAAVHVARTCFPGSQGSGIPQVIAARRLPAGHSRHHLVSIRIAAGKIGLLLFGLLCGASTGREGPTVQVGAAIMQAVGRLAPSRQSGFLLAGSAAGVAAAFNTPLAGIVFAIEEMSRSFEIRASGLVIAAIIVGGLTAQALTGDYTYFGSSYLHMASGTQWLAVPVTGAIGGLMGGLFARCNVAVARGLPGRPGLWIKAHPIITAALLGLLVAGLALLCGVELAGTGYEQSRDALHAVNPQLSLWYGPAKFVATLASAVSGIPGGVFSPSLSVGAGLGVDIAHVLNIETIGSVALLGMAAYLTGVIQAPITSFVIVAEMTENHGMLLPLMLTALIAQATARWVCKDGLYHQLADLLVPHASTSTSDRQSPA
ncbi:chloride channel protein [Oryzibacter oryziterrae]|uniref:chloride channel protein n=1 Tax=Oryzibacter oryziterrae TaxID=2766474 RepID=UPI001F1C669E|nr:chloride channel protein [Oryzibacter oryziterrae]